VSTSECNQCTQIAPNRVYKKVVNRRQFLRGALRAAGWGAGAGLLGLGGALVWVQPRRHLLQPRAHDDVTRPSQSAQRRRVVVVGGGLAGLVAATELAARNFEVTLLERAPELGGKLGGWSVRALGEEFPVEHGFHGFFSQYYNLSEVLSAAGVGDDLVPSSGYPVLFGDRPAERFGNTTRLFPFNMLSVVAQSRSLRLGDFRRDGEALYELMKFDGERTFDRFDGTDFRSFCRDGGINRPMVETVLEPFGKTTLNRLERLSAAEAIRFFHFYFMGNPEGLAFRYTRRDSLSAIITPLRRRFEALGGRVRTGVAVERLVRDGARVARVVLTSGTPAGFAVDAATRARVPASGFFALPRPDGSSLFLARRGDGLLALDGRCTHMGCPVAPDAATGGFRCPCHNGTFDAEGRPTGGPPRAPLARIAIDGSDGATPPRADALECDYCVVACEVRGLQRLLEASDFLGSPVLAQRVRSLGEADPYVVLRLWLDKPTLPSRDAFYTTSRFRYTDSLAIYSAFQEPYRSWARRTGGSVVEVHAYAIAPEARAPASTLRAAMLDELQRMLPELAGARVLHEELQQQDNFTRWAPGDHAQRPSTETELANLFLAGDHVRLPAPAALMEGAAMSGRLAANAILSREGVREVPIPTVALRGPLV
jgi:isorenieratene synthase